ncbi:hypothetical protein BX070DRAFT_231924 [Coemansia spiralis]|nr:hypothetical protein BX070DRAFT_231924 [Coemansia spiralis]
MKTAERLARLSDVLTPAYIKQQNTSANGALGSNGKQASDPNDSNSIESLLLNLANNEMQVQQQKVHAHMPKKPTRMKLLYEDHSNPGSVGRTSSINAHKETNQKQPAQLPTPNIQKKQQQQKQMDTKLGQAGLWAPPQPSSYSNNSSQIFGSTSFTSSIESMREATLRTEEASKNRNSGSMLFGPRSMPASASSRPSSRTQDSSTRSEHSTVRSQDNFSQLDIDNNSSFGSLLSTSDANSTIARASRAAHEHAISEARQLMEGIPSPTDLGSSSHHEAEYLFSDAEDDKDEGFAVDSSKFNSMISPSSEHSARFVSYSSTVSSQASDTGESIKSKRLPAIPSSTNLSLVSDTSSVGLAGQSSMGDIAQLHRSWYSSTDSLNLLGGGASLKSPDVDDRDTDELDNQQDMHAPRMAKKKSRIRPMEGTLRSLNSDMLAADQPTPAASELSNGQYTSNYDTQYNIAADFQRMMNPSNGTYSNYSASAADVHPASSVAGPPISNGTVQTSNQQSANIPVVVPKQTPQTSASYQTTQTYMAPQQAGQINGSMQQGYAHLGYTGIDANGRPLSAYKQPHMPHRQPPMAGGAAHMAYNGVSMATNVLGPGQVQEGYAHYGVPLSSATAYSQQQPQMVNAIMTGQLNSYSSLGSYPMSMAGSSVTGGDVGQAPPMPINASGRPRSYTAGAHASDSPTNGASAYSHMVAPQQQHLRSSSSTSGLQVSSAEGDIKSKLAQNSGQQSTMNRPASYGGTSNIVDPIVGMASRTSGPATPESAQTLRGSTINRGASTPTGFGTVSTTPTMTFTQREGRMSPFPSNVGLSQSPSLSGTTASDVPKETFVDELDPQLMLPMPEGVTPINYVKMTRPVFKYGGHISHPDTVNWSKVDRQMTMLKSMSAKLTVDVLATMHVGRPFNKPVERVRAAFTWIASNIQYDASAAESNEEFERHETPNVVLQRRRSRGPGFAYLFDAMMNALAIESHTIRGYLRQPLDTCQGPVLPAANHVWNVVCLDGEYRMVDTACAAKSHPLNAESKVDSWFFLASPKEAIFTHFPLSSGDQFIDPIVTLPIFWMLPYVRPTYFLSRVKLLNLPHMPRIELKDDQAIPLVLCVRDSSLSVFAEIELHDPNGSGRIVARQPLLAQCMDYKGKRMVKVLVGVRANDTRGLLKIYCGTRVPLQPKKPGDEASSQPQGKTQKMLGFLHGKDKRASAHDYSRVKDVDEEGNIKTVASAKTFPLACVLHVLHKGRNNAPTFVQPNSAIPNEFYIKEPTSAQLHLGESISFHLLPVGEERLFHMQLRSPSGQQHKFVYQPSDQGYILRHTVKERGAWIIVYHSDTEGWLPVASYQCI